MGQNEILINLGIGAVGGLTAGLLLLLMRNVWNRYFYKPALYGVYSFHGGKVQPGHFKIWVKLEVTNISNSRITKFILRDVIINDGRVKKSTQKHESGSSLDVSRTASFYGEFRVDDYSVSEQFVSFQNNKISDPSIASLKSEFRIELFTEYGKRFTLKVSQPIDLKNKVPTRIAIRRM